jgi:hypothetical protein
MCLKWEGHKGPKGASHSLSPSLILDWNLEARVGLVEVFM